MLNFLRPSEPQARLTMQDVMSMVEKDEMLLVDVRERGELAATGTAKGAIHVPVSLITMKADPKAPEPRSRAFDVNKPVAVYCASGGRSGMAAQTLQRMGFKAYNLGRLRRLGAVGRASRPRLRSGSSQSPERV